jgi:hypothetical protein
MRTTYFYYVHQQSFFISYASFTQDFLKQVSKYGDLNRLWRAGMKSGSYIIMDIFRDGFIDKSLATRTRDWKEQDFEHVISTLNLPSNIRFVLSIPVPYSYSTFFPKFSSIEGIRLHETPEEFMTLDSSLDDSWNANVDPYFLKPKGPTTIMVRLQPDVYCLSNEQETTTPQAILLQPDAYPELRP